MLASRSRGGDRRAYSAALILGLSFLACREPAKPASRNIAIPVDVGGVAAPAIDGARLLALKPDWQQGDRAAWRLYRLIDFPRSGDSAVEVEGVSGARAVYNQPSTIIEGRELVLLTDPQQGPLVARVHVSDPAGDLANASAYAPHRRVGEVRRIHVRTTAEDEAQVPSVDEVSLAIEIDGVDAGVWRAPDLDRAGRAPAERPTWLLRDVVAKLVSPEASVVAVVLEEGDAVDVPAATWADVQQVPQLRVGGRGGLRLQWVDAAGAKGERLRDVRGLRIRTRR